MAEGWSGILDLVEESVFVRDLQGRITAWNRSSQELYGHSSDAAIGQAAAELLKTEYAEPAEHIEKVLREAGGWRGEVTRYSATGERITVLARWTIQRDASGAPVAIVETGHDITERKKAEERLRYSEHRYTNLFGAMAASFWELDFSAVEGMVRSLFKSGVEDLGKYFAENPEFVREMMRVTRVIDVNDQTVALFGRGDKAELLGSVEPFWPPESTQAYAQGVLAGGVLRKPHYTIECKLRRIDGSTFDALFTAAYPPETMGKGTLLVGIIDITERKRAFAELERSEQRYRSLFHYMPIGLAQLDASGLVTLYKELHAQGVTDLGAYLDQHPDFLWRATDALLVEEVNEHNVNLWGAKSAAEMMGPITRYWRKSPATVRRALEARYRGEPFFQEETKIETFDGRVLDVLFSTARPAPLNDKSLVGFIDITDLKTAYAELERSEGRYRDLFHHMPIALWQMNSTALIAHLRKLRAQGVSDLSRHIDEHPDFIERAMALTSVAEVNQRTVDLFGGRSKMDMHVPAQRYWQASPESYRKILEARWRGDTVFEGEVTMSALDGRPIEGLLTVAFPPSLTELGISLNGFVDMTARNQSIQALQESETRFRTLFEGTSVSLWRLDTRDLNRMLAGLRERGVADLSAYIEAHPEFLAEAMDATIVADVNDKTLQLFGAADRNQLLGPVTPFFTEAGREMFRRSLEAIYRREPVFQAETTFRTLDGREIDGLFTRSSTPELRERGIVLVSIIDIGDRVRAQEMLQRVQADFAHAARVSMLGELTASIAHEVNQPLAAITTNGEAGLRWLARSEPDIAEVRELTGHMVADARRAADIISRIRTMAARRAPEKALISLDEVIEETLLFLRHEIQMRRVTTTLDLAPELPRLLGDRTQLQQVVVNLAINAMQAMAQAPGGEKAIIIRTSSPAANMLSCAVEDRGPGISSEHLGRLFESFFTTKESGLGMGLPICRSIIEAHGGAINARNLPQGGACFSFTLPGAHP